MLSIPGHKENANQNHIKIPPHSCYTHINIIQNMLPKVGCYWKLMEEKRQKA
jgi:hypothetical protein